MPQPIRVGPFEKFDLSYGFRLQPNCFLHFFRIEFFAKAWPPSLGQIYEWAGRSDQVLQFRENLPSRSRDEPIPCSCHVSELVPVVVADDQGINTMRARKISADDKFLTEIHAMLDPRATSLPWLVDAVPPFSNDALKLLLARGG